MDMGRYGLGPKIDEVISLLHALSEKHRTYFSQLYVHVKIIDEAGRLKKRIV